jgi:hypothetical protein
MYQRKIYLLVAFLTAFLLVSCSSKEVVKKTEVEAKIENLENTFKKREVKSESFSFPPDVKIEAVNIDSSNKKVTIKLNKELSYIPFRVDNVKEIYKYFRNYLGSNYSDYKFSIRTMGYDIRDLIPNYYRKSRSEYSYDRLPLTKKSRPGPVVQNISKKFTPKEGLFDRNIVVWPSHGWYYENKENRWKWQRPRLFESVEDLLPYSIVIPYLTPMLKNAGAEVFIPRERNTQPNEIIVDNDSNNEISYSEKVSDNKQFWKTGSGKGYGVSNIPYPTGLNPFRQGTYRYIGADTTASAQASWIPYIPETGYYGVYVSYKSLPNSINDARYTVYHAGGKTEFVVNQNIGGSTWEYLGKFKFFKGFNMKNGKVVLTNESSDSSGRPACPVGRVVTADGVRFGGGYGVIERNGLTSGRPKFEEASRYWLQFIGMPDSLVYSFNNNQNDYIDDYESRAEYADYLYGAPFGPNKDRSVKGLGIPIDLSLALHTDAGFTGNDSTIGTLSIYSLSDYDTSKVFPDGMSRIANRDLADLIQTQVVNDIRAKYDTNWTRRGLRNAKYSEAARPNFPSCLVELLAHQNFSDMQFALDPRFRFDVARAIYKAMLRFLSVQDNFTYQVEPLPVSHFTSYFDSTGNLVLKWKPEFDPLEPTAKPDRYVVYKRIGDGDFDNGEIVYKPKLLISDLEEGKIYSFKVTAANNGGESFPSEILSVCKMNNEKQPVLIVNGFTRICGPSSIRTNKFAGFVNFVDPGVPYKYDLSFTGPQYNFNPLSQYISNDAPGFGASSADYETKIIAGNTFDYPYIHGKSLRDAGFSFTSTSVAAFMDTMINLSKYNFIDLILGEQKATHWQRAYEDSIRGISFKTFPDKLQELIRSYLNKGGNLLVSGSYIASDLYSDIDSSGIKFLDNVLKFQYDADHASRNGEVTSTDTSFFTPDSTLTFNTILNDSIYAVQAPDAIVNNDQSHVLLRYSENQFPAAVGYKKDYGVVVMGFPFETILNQKYRDSLIEHVIKFLNLN